LGEGLGPGALKPGLGRRDCCLPEENGEEKSEYDEKADEPLRLRSEKPKALEEECMGGDKQICQVPLGR